MLRKTDRGLTRPAASKCAPALRVVIADDSYLIREGLRQVLALAPAIQVVGLYEDAPSLPAGVDKDPPDVVVTDISMPPNSWRRARPGAAT